MESELRLVNQNQLMPIRDGKLKLTSGHPRRPDLDVRKRRQQTHHLGINPGLLGLNTESPRPASGRRRGLEPPTAQRGGHLATTSEGPPEEICRRHRRSRTRIVHTKFKYVSNSSLPIWTPCFSRMTYGSISVLVGN